MEFCMYIEEFKKKVEDGLTKLHDDNSKIEFLAERLKWLSEYQIILDDIIESKYLRPENIWRRVISREDEALDPDFHILNPDNDIYAYGYDKVVNELVSEYNKDRQLDFLKKLKDDVIAPIYLSQTTEWTDIEEGVQNRLTEVQVLQKKICCLKRAIEKQVKQISFNPNGDYSSLVLTNGVVIKPNKDQIKVIEYCFKKFSDGTEFQGTKIVKHCNLNYNSFYSLFHDWKNVDHYKLYDELFLKGELNNLKKGYYKINPTYK